MQFSPTKEFRLWEGDRLVAHYLPECGYTIRESDDMLRALVLGGPVPCNQALYVEMPDLSQSEVKPGAEVEGWLKSGLVSITGMKAGGTAGSAEVKKEA